MKCGRGRCGEQRKKNNTKRIDNKHKNTPFFDNETTMLSIQERTIWFDNDDDGEGGA